MSIKGYPLSSTTSIVYEPVLIAGGSIVTIKYKYVININIDNIAPYTTTISHKVYSRQLSTDDEVHSYIGEQVLEIHNKYPCANIYT
jgi:hypothetical protein